MITKVKYTDLTATNVKVVRDGVEHSMYIEGGTWLHTELREWLDAGGVIEPAVQAPLPTLAEASFAKQAEIRDEAETFLQGIAVEYGAMEKLTWDQQAIEAEALASDPEAQAPLVRSIAAGRGMAVPELAARISANHANWASLSGYIVGLRLSYQDALEAATTVEEVAAIVPVFVLPE